MLLWLLCAGTPGSELLARQLPAAATLDAFIADSVAADELRILRSNALALQDDDDDVLTALLSPLYADGFQRPRRALTVISDARVHGKAHRKVDDLPGSAEALLSDLRSTSSHSCIGWYEMLSGGLEAMGALQPPFVRSDANRRLFSTVAQASRALASAMRRPFGEVTAHVYISAPGTSALVNHTDDYAVVALALQGAKEWRVCRHERKACMGEAVPAEEAAALDCEIIRLLPGDILYLPRGLVHSAAATDTGSAHIAIAIPPDERESAELWWGCLPDWLEREVTRSLQWGLLGALGLLAVGYAFPQFRLL